MSRSNARISRVADCSWRVRVSGHRAKFFADSAYGGKQRALDAARAWRDARWDGTDANRKLTARQRQAIRSSTEHYKDVAARYGIHPNYVHQLRRG